MSETKTPLTGVEPAWSSWMHARGAQLGLPLAGNFELTSRCNFNCKMCYVHNNRAEGELSARQWIDLGRQAAERGMVFLLLTGGEPLLRSDFREIYTGLKKLGLLISINSNGSLIDDEMFDFLRNDPPLRINISLYGCSDETYRGLCGQPAFDIVSRNIIRLHEAGISVRLNGSITPYNAQDIEGLYRFAEAVGVPLKATTYMFPPVRVNGCKYGEACHRFSPEDAAFYMLKCREQYLTPAQLATTWAEPDEDCVGGAGEQMYCRAGKTAFWVTWDGRMLPCGMFPGEGVSLLEHTFDEAWQRTRAFAGEIRLPAACTGCAHRKQCPSCAASCIAESGDASLRPDYLCTMTKNLNRLTGERYAATGGTNHACE